MVDVLRHREEGGWQRTTDIETEAADHSRAPANRPHIKVNTRSIGIEIEKEKNIAEWIRTHVVHVP